MTITTMRRLTMENKNIEASQQRIGLVRELIKDLIEFEKPSNIDPWRSKQINRIIDIANKVIEACEKVIKLENNKAAPHEIGLAIINVDEHKKQLDLDIGMLYQGYYYTGD